MKKSLANRLTAYWLGVSSLMYLVIAIPTLLPPLAALVFICPHFVLETLDCIFAVDKFQAFLTPFLLIFFVLRIEKFQDRKTIAALMTINWALWAYSIVPLFLTS